MYCWYKYTALESSKYSRCQWSTPVLSGLVKVRHTSTVRSLNCEIHSLHCIQVYINVLERVVFKPSNTFTSIKKDALTITIKQSFNIDAGKVNPILIMY